MSTGQITLDSPFGAALAALGADSKYKVFVEVGTWNGRGSTECVVAGILKQARPGDCHFYSLEAVGDKFKEAHAYWSTQAHPFLHLLHGHLNDAIMTREEVEAHPAFDAYGTLRQHYKNWYEGEAAALAASPLIQNLPTFADVVILDGGEFTTAGDWEVLKKMAPRVVALDDTHLIKTSSILAELRAAGWREVAVGADRNGWAILSQF
jgi:hypothetical protein